MKPRPRPDEDEQRLYAPLIPLVDFSGAESPHGASGGRGFAESLRWHGAQLRGLLELRGAQMLHSRWKVLLPIAIVAAFLHAFLSSAGYPTPPHFTPMQVYGSPFAVDALDANFSVSLTGKLLNDLLRASSAAAAADGGGPRFANDSRLHVDVRLEGERGAPQAPPGAATLQSFTEAAVDVLKYPVPLLSVRELALLSMALRQQVGNDPVGTLHTSAKHLRITGGTILLLGRILVTPDTANSRYVAAKLAEQLDEAAVPPSLARVEVQDSREDALREMTGADDVWAAIHVAGDADPASADLPYHFEINMPTGVLPAGTLWSDQTLSTNWDYALYVYSGFLALQRSLAETVSAGARRAAERPKPSAAAAGAATNEALPGRGANVAMLPLPTTGCESGTHNMLAVLVCNIATCLAALCVATYVVSLSASERSSGVALFLRRNGLSCAWNRVGWWMASLAGHAVYSFALVYPVLRTMYAEQEARTLVAFCVIHALHHASWTLLFLGSQMRTELAASLVLFGCITQMSAGLALSDDPSRNVHGKQFLSLFPYSALWVFNTSLWNARTWCSIVDPSLGRVALADGVFDPMEGPLISLVATCAATAAWLLSVVAPSADRFWRALRRADNGRHARTNARGRLGALPGVPGLHTFVLPNSQQRAKHADVLFRACREEVGGRPLGPGFCPATAAPIFGVSLRRAVRLFALLRERRCCSTRDEVDYALASVGLLEHAATSMDKLSGGQLRRALVACATVSSPHGVVVDSPFAGLDPLATEAVATYLRAFADSGPLGKQRTVLLTLPSAVAVAVERSDSVRQPSRGQPWPRLDDREGGVGGGGGGGVGGGGGGGGGDNDDGAQSACPEAPSASRVSDASPFDSAARPAAMLAMYYHLWQTSSLRQRAYSQFLAPGIAFGLVLFVINHNMERRTIFFDPSVYEEPHHPVSIFSGDGDSAPLLRSLADGYFSHAEHRLGALVTGDVLDVRVNETFTLTGTLEEPGTGGPGEARRRQLSEDGAEASWLGVEILDSDAAVHVAPAAGGEPARTTVQGTHATLQLQPEFTIFHNLTARHSAPIVASLALRSVSGADVSFSSSLIIDPYHADQMALMIRLLLCILFVAWVLPSFGASMLLRDDERRQKHSFLLAGMTPVQYWLGNALVQVALLGSFSALLLVELLLVLPSSAAMLPTAESTGGFLLSLLVYMFAAVNFIAFLTKAWPSTSEAALCLSTTMASSVTFTAAHFMPGMTLPGTAAGIVQALLPGFNLGEALIKVLFKPWGELYGWAARMHLVLPPIDFSKSLFHPKNAGFDIITAVCQGVAYFLLTVAVDEASSFRAWVRAATGAPRRRGAPGKLGGGGVARGAHGAGARGGDGPIVSAQAVSKRVLRPCSGFRALVQDVSFDVRVGEVLGLVGGSGAGKTTVFRMLAGEVLPSSGHISFFGGGAVATACGYPMYAVRGRVAYCPQQARFASDFTVERMLWSYRAAANPETRMAPQEIATLVKQLGLADCLRVPTNRLAPMPSKKLAITVALIMGAELLLLDEPMAGLSPVEQARICSVIRQFCGNRRCGIIITSHAPEVIAALCTRVIELRKGGIVLPITYGATGGGVPPFGAAEGAAASSASLHFGATGDESDEEAKLV